MPTMSVARGGSASREAGLFNQIAMFSAMGLGVWVALVIGYGLQVTNPWF